MRDEELRESSNIEDVRGSGGGGFGGGGFGGGRGPRIPIRGGGGLGMIIVVVLILLFGGGGSLTGLLGDGSGDTGTNENGYQSAQQNNAPPVSQTPTQERTRARVSRVLASTEDFWGTYFQRERETYPQPTLRLFSGQTDSACGTANSASGPFYCPGDNKIYLDMAFFDEMDRGLGAKGDFAQAYVIAHEVGHHVQNVLGILPQAHRAMRSGGEDKGEDSIAVRVELQADCFAGLWASKSTVTATLEPGDIEEAIGAASAVGDDRLQKRAQGYAVPDSFTHGSSEQRMRWFMAGFRGADINVCDTFRARAL